MTDRRELTELLTRVRLLGCVVETSEKGGELASARFVGEPGCGPHPITSLVGIAERLREVRARREALTQATTEWNGAEIVVLQDGEKIVAVHPAFGPHVIDSDHPERLTSDQLVELFRSTFQTTL